MSKKMIGIILAVTVLLGVLTACGSKDTITSDTDYQGTKAAQARTLENIREDGKIRIGVFSDKNPFGYVDADGEIQGCDVYFALPYIKVALGVVSLDDGLITDVEQLNGKTLIVVKGTTAETYFTENYPDVNLLKFDEYQEAYDALSDGRGDAFSTDNTEVLAWALQNKGFSVGIESIGNLDAIAPAVQKGNTELLEWINQEIEVLAEEQFFHADYKATLEDVYGSSVDPDSLVVEGGKLEE